MIKTLLLIFGLLLLLAFGACSTNEPAPTTVPDVVNSGTKNKVAAPAPSAPSAPAQQPPVSIAVSPVPLSIAAVESVLTFGKAYDQISVEWDAFHKDLDTWRQGLNACDASAVRAALGRLASLAADLTRDARDLPRSPDIRSLADSLSAAAAGQEAAFRDLRDDWHPDAEAIFEAVEAERSNAASARNVAQDTTLDLLQKTSPSSQIKVISFSAALAVINGHWDRLHTEYNDLRAREAELTTSELVSELSKLVESFTAIAVQIRELPYDSTTATISSIFSEAADDEELALRNLRNAFAKSGPAGDDGLQSSAGEDVLPPPTGPDGESGQEQGVTFSTSESDRFQAFGAQLVESNAARRHAMEAMADVLKEVSPDARVNIGEFEVEFRTLTTEWSSFDEEYLDWRRTEGGCDSTAAIEALAKFNTDFSALARRVRALPSVPPLLSLGEIFVEAVDREEMALRSLRDEWRPFDTVIYGEIETQRTTVAKLRRQVGAGLANILAKYLITLPERGM